MTERDPLPSWRPGATRDAVLDFLDAAAEIPLAQRVAVFDNDGTLWCEKPRYTQLEFFLAELADEAARRPELRGVPEYRALLSGDSVAVSPAELSARSRDSSASRADESADMVRMLLRRCRFALAIHHLPGPGEFTRPHKPDRRAQAGRRPSASALTRPASAGGKGSSGRSSRRTQRNWTLPRGRGC